MFLLGVETKNGGIGVVGFFVNEYDGNLSGVHLYICIKSNTKKEGVVLNATRGSSDNFDASSPSYIISVSQLLGIVKEAYPKNVLEHLGCSREKSSVRNSLFKADSGGTG